MTSARFLVAGCSGIFLGVGLQRFAYGPLLPAMVQAGWLGPGAAGVLGAVNLGGYLAGALAGPAVGRRFGVVPALRWSMLITALSFAPCAIDGGLAWFVPWRSLAGVTGGVLMALTGPAVQAAVPPRLRGRAAGVTISGVGLGVMAGAVLVPALLPLGLPASWLAVCAAGLAATALAWRRWPEAAPVPPAASLRANLPPGALRLLAAYALVAVAAAPHMAWWPDYIARGLGLGTAYAGLFWALFGAAGVAGPAICGWSADRIGTVPTLLAASAAQALALALPLLDHRPAALLVSTILGGATPIGMTALTLARTREVAGASGPALWALCSADWGAAQTASGFALAWLYTRTGGHAALFAAGLAAALLAFPLLAAPRPARLARTTGDTP